MQRNNLLKSLMLADTNEIQSLEVEIKENIGVIAPLLKMATRFATAETESETAKYIGWDTISNEISNAKTKIDSTSHILEISDEINPLLAKIENILSTDKELPVPSQVYILISAYAQNIVISMKLDMIRERTDLFNPLTFEKQDKINIYEKICLQLLKIYERIYPRSIQEGQIDTINKGKKNRAPIEFHNNIAPTNKKNKMNLIEKLISGFNIYESLQNITSCLASIYIRNNDNFSAEHYALAALYYDSKIEDKHIKIRARCVAVECYAWLAIVSSRKGKTKLISYYLNCAERSLQNLIVSDAIVNLIVKSLESVCKYLLTTAMKQRNYQQAIAHIEQLNRLVQKRKHCLENLWEPQLKAGLNIPFFSDGSADSIKLISLKNENNKVFLQFLNDYKNECANLLEIQAKLLIKNQTAYFLQINKLFDELGLSQYYTILHEKTDICITPTENSLRQSLKSFLKRYKIGKDCKSIYIPLASHTVQKINKLFSLLLHYQTQSLQESFDYKVYKPTEVITTSPDVVSHKIINDKLAKDTVKSENGKTKAKMFAKIDAFLSELEKCEIEQEEEKLPADLIPVTNKFIPHDLYYAKLDHDILKKELTDVQLEWFNKKVNPASSIKLLTGVEDGSGIKFIRNDYHKKSIEKYNFKLRFTHGPLGDVRIYGKTVKDADKIIILFDHVVLKAHKTLSRANEMGSIIQTNSFGVS